MMRVTLVGWFVLVFLVFGTWLDRRPLEAAADGAAKKLAILPFHLSSAGADREWLGEGFAHVLALRLAHLTQLKVTVLPGTILATPEGAVNLLESAEVIKFLEGLRPQGYDAVIVGHFLQSEPPLRVEVQVWMMRPEGPVSRVQEQVVERDPDGLGIKLATFVLSALQSSPSDAEGRRYAERYTTSAEAFDRFARALALAEVSDGDEDMAQAVMLFKEAVKLDAKFVMAIRQQGELLFRRGQYAGASEAYQAFLSTGRRSGVVYRLLGNAYFAQGDITRAIEAYKRALQLDARDAQLHLDLGLAYAALQDYANATKMLLRALEFKPDDPLAFANLGVVYLLQGNFPAATASLRRAQLLQDSDPILSYNLGLSLMFEGVYEQAREHFARALQLKPDFAAAAYQLALLDERLGSATAAERWRTYLDLARAKSEEQAWLTRAEAHLRRLQRQ